MVNVVRSLVLQQCNSSQLSRDDRPDAGSLPTLSRCLRSTDLCAVQRYGDVCWRCGFLYGFCCWRMDTSKHGSTASQSYFKLQGLVIGV